MYDLAKEMNDALPGLAVQALRVVSGQERIPGRDSWAMRVLGEANRAGLVGLTPEGRQALGA